MKTFEVDAEQLLPDAIKEHIREELIRCRHCRHGVVTAMLIHRDGSIDYSYMCDIRKRPTSGDGHCDQGERIEKEDDG